MEHEYKILAQKWEVAKDRQGRDHETITDLENKLQSLELSRTSANGDSNGLDDELEKSERVGTSTAKYDIMPRTDTLNICTNDRVMQCKNTRRYILNRRPTTTTEIGLYHCS